MTHEWSVRRYITVLFRNTTPYTPAFLTTKAILPGPTVLEFDGFSYCFQFVPGFLRQTCVSLSSFLLRPRLTELNPRGSLKGVSYAWRSHLFFQPSITLYRRLLNAG
jgi:hypothetical protein